MPDLPVYKGTVSENDDDLSEVTFISLVDFPAIKSNFLKFKEAAQSYAITNDEEQIVTGLAMIADMPLYRKDEDGEFYVVYDAASIKTIAQKFFRKGYTQKVNAMHDSNQIVDAYFFESWIVDRTKGKPPMAGFEDITDGSWFVSAKINDPEAWQSVKDGKFKGFSVEGFFKLERVGATVEEITDEQILSALVDLIHEQTV